MWDTGATKPLGFYSSFFLNVSRHQTPCLHVHLNAFFKGNRNPTNINILDFEVTYNLWNDLNLTKTWLRFKHKVISCSQARETAAVKKRSSRCQYAFSKVPDICPRNKAQPGHPLHTQEHRLSRIGACSQGYITLPINILSVVFYIIWTNILLDNKR